MPKPKKVDKLLFPASASITVNAILVRTICSLAFCVLRLAVKAREDWLQIIISGLIASLVGLYCYTDHNLQADCPTSN